MSFNFSQPRSHGSAWERALAAEDMEKMLAFYVPLLGRQPDVNIEQVYAEFHLPGLRLGIFQPKDSHRQEFESRSSGSMSLCLEVDDLERAIAHLRTLGYQPLLPESTTPSLDIRRTPRARGGVSGHDGDISTASHGREIYAYDPQGNRLILHQSWDMG